MDFLIDIIEFVFIVGAIVCAIVYERTKHTGPFYDELKRHSERQRQVEAELDRREREARRDAHRD